MKSIPENRFWSIYLGKSIEVDNDSYNMINTLHNESSKSDVFSTSNDKKNVCQQQMNEEQQKSKDSQQSVVSMKLDGLALLGSLYNDESEEDEEGDMKADVHSDVQIIGDKTDTDKKKSEGDNGDDEGTSDVEAYLFELEETLKVQQSPTDFHGNAESNVGNAEEDNLMTLTATSVPCSNADGLASTSYSNNRNVRNEVMESSQVPNLRGEDSPSVASSNTCKGILSNDDISSSVVSFS